MAKEIYLFIILIRAIAAITITNAHYTGVYPTDLIANGGLLGDVLFFAVSGFCLANTKEAFPKWYLRRFIRIYIPVWVITVIYMLLGLYTVTNLDDGIKFFFWPTHWHFVASIIILYIPLYFISKFIEMNTKNYVKTASLIFVLQLVFYFTIYDRSYYHIDSVYQPMIEFLFFQSMLMGVYFRWRCNEVGYCNMKLKLEYIIIGSILLGIYFLSKILFVKYSLIANFQILNQVILGCLLYVLFLIFVTLEVNMQKIKGTKFFAIIKYISDRTLEIYLVQYVILDHLKVGPFPLNWLLLTSTIIAVAEILRWLSQQIIRRIRI
ncbi:hypothetical protein DWX56_06005 [Parabacteroides merdae]|jgi:hypothetical protein|uniref:acyltransferase family protein n=1 Tax=Parabacteroides merdae TaxID=46503 RepID=UPI000EFB17C3|nr:acyltransferase family protein [Parabacteroides merdae]MCI7343663.1 acyltransferase [Fusobacterium necrophorum]MCI7461349.1 acyltransferase [Parabacteroides merdae]RGT02611.1 hypothetical protein DWX56_06005 [Parabacteroides merdae]